MSLQEEVEKIAADYLPDPPQNEADTCHWIVYPLLLACGYAPRDISSQRSDAIREFPDYTLLLNAPQHTWFVEAKAWNVMLEDRHAQQALNYTNTNGKRWVVLTNGRVWRLYDNSIQGVADDKRAAEANLDNPASVVEFLTALSKEAVCGDQVAGYALRSRLRATLDTELRASDSKLIDVITRTLRNDYALNNIKSQDVAGFFNIIGPPAEHKPEQHRSRKRQVQTPPDAKASKDVSALLECGFDKVVQQTHTLARRKPAAVRFEGATEWTPLVSWAEFVAAVVKWIAVQKKLPPLPFQPTQGSRYFLNTTPYHVDASERMRTFKEVQTTSGIVYASTNTSTLEKIGWLCALCESAGVATTDIFMKLS